MKRFRALIVLIVVISILFLIGGFVIITLGYWDKDAYVNIAAIVGGVASSLGLLGFLIPSVDKDDLEKVGLEYMKNVVKASEELKTKEGELLKKESELTAKEKEIETLKIKKQELEVLVRKATLRLFLQDQMARNDEGIKRIIEENNELKGLLVEREPLKEKLNSLQMEIDSDPNVKVLEEIIRSSKPEKENVSKPLAVRFFDEFMEALIDAIKPLFLR